MPEDTLPENVQNKIAQIQDSIYKATIQPVNADFESFDNPSIIEFFFITICILSFLTILFRPFITKKWKKYQQKKIRGQALIQLGVNYIQYNNWLLMYNEYYKSLPISLKNIFLQRVVEFMNSKNFDFINMADEEKIPLLISAAAVQVTFGLDKYLLNFFDTIHVLPNDYQFGLSNRLFMGHVCRSGIYLSWNNFLDGFQDYTDAHNVGIHEMAHALACVNFTLATEDDEDELFKQRFHQFSAVARPIFNDMQNGIPNMLDNYAATNYDEFWAVAAENFFEKSLQMKMQMPQLYSAIRLLLNQDPLLPEKILQTTCRESNVGVA